MALVNDIAAAVYLFRDNDGKERNITLYAEVPAAPTDYPNLITFFDAIGDIISNNITVCNLFAYDLYIIKREDTIVATAGAEVERVALFEIKSAANGEPSFVLSIPCLLSTHPSVGGDGVIDTAHPDISAIIDMLIAGDGTVSPCDARGIDLVASSGTLGSYKIERAVKYHTRSKLSTGIVGG